MSSVAASVPFVVVLAACSGAKSAGDRAADSAPRDDDSATADPHDDDSAVDDSSGDSAVDSVPTDSGTWIGWSGTYELSTDAVVVRATTNSSDAARIVKVADMTGDGTDDLVVATTVGETGYGGGFVVPGPLLASATLEDIGHEITSSVATYGASRSLGVGDVDGDGFPDVAFGAPYGAEPGQYVIYGPITADADLPTQYDVALIGDAGIWCGHGSDVGDVDGDGIADAVVAAYADDSGGHGSGTVFLQRGPLDEDVDLEAGADVEIVGAHADAYAGRVVHAGMDVNGDGIGDFALNATSDPTGGPSSGAVYVVLGPVTITALADGAMLVGGPQSYSGESFTAGDFDGDGRDDIATSVNGPAPGGVYVVHGPVDKSFDLADADNILLADSRSQLLGLGLGAGDIDGNGTDELLIGAPTDGEPGDKSGSAFLVFDPPAGTSLASDVARARFQGDANQDQTGQAEVLADADADGVPDLVIGAPQMSAGGGFYVMYPPP